MIYLGNVWTIEAGEYDEVWVICRSVQELNDMFSTHKNVIHVPELAPSDRLFKHYRSLVHAGEWDKSILKSAMCRSLWRISRIVIMHISCFNPSLVSVMKRKSCSPVFVRKSLSICAIDQLWQGY